MNPKSLSILAMLVASLAFNGAYAQILKVDVSGATGRGDTAAPGFTEWQTYTDSGSNNRSATKTFGSLTINFSQLQPSAANPLIYLEADYANKDGITHGYKMAFDGIRVHHKDDNISHDGPYLDGGALRMTITGFTPGTHTIITYHNALWPNSKWGAPSKTQIFADGVLKSTVTPTVVATSDDETAYAFFSVEATEGNPVVIDFIPDGSNPQDAVFINGFEIDNPAPPGDYAIEPVPFSGDEHVDTNMDDHQPGSDGSGYTTLSWTPASTAVMQDLYFGPDESAIAAAGTSTPGLYRGRQAGSTLDVTGLSSHETYYWRVDTVKADTSVVKGIVWSFKPRHLAFPTAEGWGRFAIGGRGGTVHRVTNLNDSGPGSLRAGIEASGPRTIVFDVSGIIDLDSRLILRNPHCTVAGQTAPGKGICIKDYDFGSIGGNDFIIRHVRVRVGKEIGTDKTLGGMGMGSTDHAIIDHCSISWSQDEVFSSRQAGNITLQRTLISEALHYAGHNIQGGTHGYAASIGGSVASFHHNLLAHCEGRNWSLAGGLDQSSVHTGSLDIRNNVVYNWRNRATDGGAKEVNFVRNYYKPGPATTKFTEINPTFEAPGFGPQQYYVEGNVLEGHHGPEGPLPPFEGMDVQGSQPWPVTLPDPFFEHYVETHTAAEAYTNVLADVGCTMPMQDDHDKRIIREVRDGTFTFRGSVSNRPGLIDNQADSGGWEDYPQESRPVDWDTDGDGMPNWFEDRMGFDPDDPADRNSDHNGDGYTNLELYLNYMAGEVDLDSAGAHAHWSLLE